MTLPEIARAVVYARAREGTAGGGVILRSLCQEGGDLLDVRLHADAGEEAERADEGLAARVADFGRGDDEVVAVDLTRDLRCFALFDSHVEPARAELFFEFLGDDGRGGDGGAAGDEALLQGGPALGRGTSP